MLVLLSGIFISAQQINKNVHFECLILKQNSSVEKCSMLTTSIRGESERAICRVIPEQQPQPDFLFADKGRLNLQCFAHRIRIGLHLCKSLYCGENKTSFKDAVINLNLMCLRFPHGLLAICSVCLLKKIYCLYTALVL